MRSRNEIVNETLEVIAKVDKAGHSGYARRLVGLLQELVNTPPAMLAEETREAGQ